MAKDKEGFIEILGAREHNLKDIDLSIPRNKLVVFTGLSGSGKSSLAFDTIYAEGQRRYIESFSSYARQFLGEMKRPDVDKINGLSPVIAIEQKSVNRNPRSTVGTITEIYDFLRLLFARAGVAYSYITNEKMIKFSEDDIYTSIMNDYQDKIVHFFASLVQGRKGHYRELFEKVRKLGYIKCRIDGVITEIPPGHRVDRYKVHDIEVLIDTLRVSEKNEKRLKRAIKDSLKHGKGSLMLQAQDEESVRFFSKNLMCPTTGISYNDPAPNLFSFNSPYGACNKCNGLGKIREVEITKIIPDNNLSISKGGITALGKERGSWIFKQLKAIGSKYNFTLDTPIKNISEEAMNVILNGTTEPIKFTENEGGLQYNITFDGIIPFIESQQEEDSVGIRRWAESFMEYKTCSECNGTRLKKEALYFKIDNQNIAELSQKDLTELAIWAENIESKLDERQKIISSEILKEIRKRIKFLLDVGLEYLNLDRAASTLSGGESQRIRLATQIGSQLMGVLYILDEPSIGLHQRDNDKLIKSLKNLRNIGNSVLVVEHDKDMILESDFVVDIGPGAGINGGKIVAAGTPEQIMQLNTLTVDYLNGTKNIEVPLEKRKGNGLFLEIKGANGNNLKNIDIKFPLGKFICVTGVSGSGKSTLINETLQPILSQYFYNSVKEPMPYKKVLGLEHIDKVISIDQSPIGRTPRSNPATYTGVFTDIRALFAELPEAKIRGYKPGRFSFNVKGGRCEDCQGGGMKVIEMNFLPDVHIKCNTCQGKRYNRETLEVRYKGKSISDVLDMEIVEAVKFFEHIPSIYKKLKTLDEIGLGYITLGQSSVTLSGGEAQRIKLASELNKNDTGKTFYILDEPTTGLHFEDISILLNVLNKLADKGNTILVIEHNMDVIKSADYIIDLGPEGGIKGGNILVTGTPEEVAESNIGYTSKYLRKELNKCVELKI